MMVLVSWRTDSKQSTKVTSRIMVDRGQSIAERSYPSITLTTHSSDRELHQIESELRNASSEHGHSAADTNRRTFDSAPWCVFLGCISSSLAIAYLRYTVAGFPPPVGNQDMNEKVPTLNISRKRKSPEEESPLTDEELMLASPIVYGFSLSDKIWRTSL